ncbi:protein translocase subunit SecDF [Flavisolibacter nicotianae]|uniref:protein translocase subunit SecDF n=1 Tax=Flavisolibacter nicotianae TaxID=2364882 RepID=UPI000EB2EE0A|nr:protein translocase subunit SecDF [Flavisolibacter nicotianae]
MQLKGLIRFFTILLIVYSIYELSFTWVVRGHERKMEAKAKQFVSQNYPNADENTKAELYKDRLKRLLDSTKEENIYFGVTGPISYQKAKGEELNLGLDLQGGINVTLEVELSGLLRSMANNSKDANFQKALEGANARKANSSADFVTLFVEEYKKASNNAPLAPLFAAASAGKISPKDADDKVIGVIREEANAAFERTFRVLQTRIDQFGVAQPNINPNKERGVITVELPGLQDQERVRKYLQSSANLQFWLTYKPEEFYTALVNADKNVAALEKATNTTTATPQPTRVDTAKTTTTDTSGVKKLSTLNDTTAKAADTSALAGNNPLLKLFQQAGYGLVVAARDTDLVRTYLNSDVVRRAFTEAGLADARFSFGIPGRDANGKRLNVVPFWVLKTANSEKAPMEGDVITTAAQSYDQMGGKPTVTMDIGPAGNQKWGRLTETSNKEQRPIAITLDDIVYSAPVARDKITGGRTEISGDFTLEEAQDLANILKAGKLPAPAKIVQEQVVGPTLGQHAIKGGILAFVISFIVIFLLMLVYYNTSGWVANIALILNLLFTIGVLTGLGATLTAPGIAGLVLTIGMAVDTNVIIYERIKEELSKGKGYIPAVNEGYKRSLPPVLDAHVTTLLTAIILFSFGLGPVKGFATTQIIGILLSLFCGILVSRWVTEWFTNKKRHLEYFTPISRKILKHPTYRFIEYRKVAYVISAIVLILGVGSIFNGFHQGVEFKGGRSYIVHFDQPISDKVEDVRKDLEHAFGEAPVIKTIGNNQQLDITTSYQISNSSPATDSIVGTKLMEGLRKYAPATSYAQFRSKNIIGTTTVLPTISDDLKNGAIKATIFSLMIICLYIFIRFRDWRYSLGTIVALLHDVLVTLAVFSFLKNIVPFPLELDQHFIAAVLTVIGFSMNDTVIVFDRIREYSRQLVGAPKETVINRAINETLSRTIMTSLTVFLTILILFLVGGEVTKGFAFAMLIGVITGTYSSIFVAAPILVDLGGKKPLGASNDTTPAGKTAPKAKAQKV